MRIRVECYEGYKAGESPREFLLGAHRYRVNGILDRWYGPEHDYFRVEADDGNVYILRHHRSPDQDVWTLESFRKRSKIDSG